MTRSSSPAPDLASAIASYDVAAIQARLGQAPLPTTIAVEDRGLDPLVFAANQAHAATSNEQRDASQAIARALVDVASPSHRADALIACASEDHHLGALTELLRAGIEVDVAIRDNNTALMRAAGNGCIRASYALLKAGADAQREGAYGSAEECSSGTVQRMIESQRTGTLASPRQLLAKDSELEATLRSWLHALPALAEAHPSEVFYVFALDGGTVRGNGEEAFAKTLTRYREQFPGRYDDAEAVSQLRSSPGDWSYALDCPRAPQTPLVLDLGPLEVRDDDDRTYPMLMTELLSANQQIFAASLKLSSEFRIGSTRHSF